MLEYRATLEGTLQPDKTVYSCSSPVHVLAFGALSLATMVLRQVRAYGSAVCVCAYGATHGRLLVCVRCDSRLFDFCNNLL